MRTQLIEMARPVLSDMVDEATGVAVVSLHHDISTVTGEEVILFTLADPARRPGRQEEVAATPPPPGGRRGGLALWTAC